jgi:predicted RND superfamily exporter protein
MKAFVSQAKAEAEAMFPGWKVTTSNMAATVHELNNELCMDLIYGFWQALIAISLVLMVVFRSVRWTIAAAVPNLVPVIVLLGSMALGGTAIKPGIALIFSIALGVSFDNTVYLLGRLRLLRDRSSTGEISACKAWFQEGNLCLFSSFALVSGFMVYLASYFSLNQEFGFYMVMAVLGGMLGDLVLLPAMLAAFPAMVKNRNKASVVALESVRKPVDSSDQERLVA